MFFFQAFFLRASMILVFCSLAQCIPVNRITYPAHEQVAIVNLEISKDVLDPTEDLVWKEVVKVQSSSGQGTGTLFNVSGKVIAITAAHVVRNDASVLLIDTGANEVMGGDVIYNDPNADIAVILTAESNRGLPLKFSHDVAGVSTDIFAVAHPNMHNKMLMRGEVAGYSTDPTNFYILLQGFAWPGSSGASIFDKDGNLIGIVSAIDIGRTSKKNFQLVPEVVWVKPAQLIDLNLLQSSIQS